MSSSTKKSEASSPEKTVLSLPHGRMVVLEELDEEKTEHTSLVDLAREGKGEGYVRYNRTAENTVNTSDAPGMVLRILIRPAMHAQAAGRLAAITAVAVARALERYSDMQIGIRWLNDLYCGSRRMATMFTHAQTKPDGYFDYAVIRVAIAIADEDFPPRLGDVIRRVFNNETISLSALLAEAIVQEFFSIYDDVTLHPAYMEEYRKRSTVIGRRVKVLVDGGYAVGRIADIDENACPVVRLHRKRTVTVKSRSEIVL